MDSLGSNWADTLRDYHLRTLELFDAALADRQKNDERQFEADYLEYLGDRYGKLKMLGVREMHDVRQQLKIAYVTLRMRTGQNDKGELDIRDAERALLSFQLLTIRGPAGSGKSTLCHWIIHQCTQVAIDGTGESETRNLWKGGVPFYVPLRRLTAADKGAPAVDQLVEFGVDAKIFAEKPPRSWITNVLKNQKRGVVLLDGLDELSATQRPGFWKWLRGFIERYPGNRVVITSRPFRDETKDGKPARKLWNPPREQPHAFHETILEDMNDADIRIFINNWHGAVLEYKKDPDARAELERRRDELPGKLLDDPANTRIRELCRTPLLCALVCVLHWREEGYLPEKRVDLYDRCCAMLIDERDRKRDIKPPDPPLSYITKDDKAMLLQRLALDMMRNVKRKDEDDHAIEVSRGAALAWLKPNLKAVDDPRARECQPDEVLDFLEERTSLLRFPSTGRVDYPHRTFQEYLAACAAGAGAEGAEGEGGYYGELADKAGDDQWRETIVLAAGTPDGGKPFGRRLIQELLARGEDKRRKSTTRLSCLALAVACLDTYKGHDAQLRERVLGHLKEIVPPIDMDHAKALAAAGPAVVEHLRLAKMKKHGGYAVARCARTLRLIACNEAVTELKEHYGRQRWERVLTEVCTTPSIEPLELNGIQNYIKQHGKTPMFIHEHISKLDALLQMDKLKSLRIGDWNRGCPRVRDIAPLAELKNLVELGLYGFTRVSDFSSLKRLKCLRRLEIRKGLSLSDSGLAFPDSLREFMLHNCLRLESLSSLSNLTALQHLKLHDLLQVQNLAPLSNFASLQHLLLDDLPKVSDLSPLDSCSELTSLSIRNMHKVRNLPAPSSFSSLQSLELEGLFELRSLSPLSGCESLQELVLSGLQNVTDYSALKGLLSLQRLTLIQLLNFRDLSPLAFCKALKRLNLYALHVEDLSPLESCTELESLGLLISSPKCDLEPLERIPNLKELRIDEHLINKLPAKVRKIARPHSGGG